ncbi:MAG: hypothetical protein J6B33_00670 [Prevotella sp.]|nr:hypothetical protein [Prevotella sp.]
MKHKIFATLTLLLFCLTSMGQAKKPTLMIVPSNVWCNKNGYMTTFNNQGVKEEVPDYVKALNNSMDLTAVISQIGGLMADRGFPLKDLQQTTKSLNNLGAENSLLRSKTSGAAIAESPLDRLRRIAKADIIMELQWDIVSVGPKKQVRYILRGLDAYSNKQVATAQGIGPASFSAPEAVLLEEAVTDKMDNFCSQLQAHFDDMQKFGREVTVDVMVFDNGSGIDLEKEYGDMELVEVIDGWFNENTVEHRFSKSDATETFALYEQVRIPLYNTNNMPMDTEQFVRKLAKFLRQAPYNITCKTVNRGLGRCALIIGEK